LLVSWQHSLAHKHMLKAQLQNLSKERTWQSLNLAE
jgi:hypothetical protein